MGRGVTGVRVGSGDVLLIRTGRWEAVRQLGQWNFVERAAGSHASVAKSAEGARRGVIGSDGVSDDHRMPSGVAGLAQAPSARAASSSDGCGMPASVDRRSTSTIWRSRKKRPDRGAGGSSSSWATSRGRVVGGTGSPLNPLAVF